MSIHSNHIHAEVHHAEHVGHEDANGVAAITARYIAELEAAGHKIAHHHHLRGDGHVHVIHRTAA